MLPSESVAFTVYDPLLPGFSTVGPFIKLQLGGLLGRAFTIKLKGVERVRTGEPSVGEPFTVIPYVPAGIDPVLLTVKVDPHVGLQGLFA